MLIAKLSLIGSAFAAQVQRVWSTNSNCTGTPSAAFIFPSLDNALGASNGTVCPLTPTSCKCDSMSCRADDYCTLASANKLVSDTFGTRKIVQVGKSYSMIQFLLIFRQL